MKTQTIPTNEMTLQPFFGRPANQTTHNPTGTGSHSTVATTHDHKEVAMKSQIAKQHNDTIGISLTKKMSAFHSLGIALLVLLTSILMLAGPAQAQFEAHCLCRLATDQGGSVKHLDNYIKDFGTVGDYHALFPQDPYHQAECARDCSGAPQTQSWFGSKADMCHSFAESGGGDLVLYDDLGTLDWVDIGRSTAANFGYPQTCFGTPGFVFPTYYVMSLIYAPPGCTQSQSLNYPCSPASSVQYSDGSTIGTTTSTEKSFSKGVTLTATETPDPTHLILPFSADQTLGYTVKSVQDNSTTVTKTASNTISWSPQSQDGIYHDFDIFEAVVNPAVMVRNWLDPLTLQNNVEWEMGIRASDGVAFTYFYTAISVKCALAGYSNLPIPPSPGYPNPGKYDPPGECPGSSAWWLPSNAPPGLTYSDYDQMLSLDPFVYADPSQPLNPKPSAYPASGPPRYTLQPYGYPYSHPSGGTPPTAVGGPPACISYTWQQSVENSKTISSSWTWDTMASVSATFSPPAPANWFTFKVGGTLDWSNMTSNQTTKANSQSGQATIMCSSIDWAGPGFVTVWYDNLFGTYLFDLADYPCPGCKMLLNGRVTLVNGAIVPGVQVELGDGTTTYHTATDNNGHFVFFTEDTNPIESLAATLSVGGVSKPVTIGSQEQINVVVPQQAPVIAVYREDSPGIPAGSGDHRRDAIAMRFTNLSGVTTATNVTVTAVAPTNAAIVYEPGELTLPFVIPGGAALKPGETSSFNLDFTDTSGTAPAPFSFVIKVKADNVPEFSTTIKVP
ncbi:MAG: hypothetical protein ACHP8B_10615 [Terriglobales bacterium]